MPTRPGHVTGVMAGGVMEDPTGRKEPQKSWCDGRWHDGESHGS